MYKMTKKSHLETLKNVPNDTQLTITLACDVPPVYNSIKSVSIRNAAWLKKFLRSKKCYYRGGEIYLYDWKYANV
jgi:hypothetical protein